MINLKEIFPFEAVAPMIGGAIVWFGANYIVIAPEVIGPRLQEKYYAPMCLQLVETDRKVRAQREQTLVDQFENKMDKMAMAMRRQANAGARGLFGLFGAEGHAFWNKYGDRLGGSVGSMAAAPIQAQLDAQRNAFYGTLEKERAEAKEAMKFETADGYCGCVVEDVLSNRFDLASYTASLRFYTPPSIRNIETGTAFTQSPVCGAVPIA